MNIDRIEPIVRATWWQYGESVATAFVGSFEEKYGANSPYTIVANSTLRSLMGVKESPSELSRALFDNAPVSIPGARSSGEPRRKGRSID